MSYVLTHFTARSGNSKLGPMSATYRTQESCPDTCPLIGDGCYAHGRLFSFPQRYGHSDIPAIVDRMIAEVPIGGMVRFEVTGDVMTVDGKVDWEWIRGCNRFAKMRPDVRIIRYTHSWQKVNAERFAYPVNASCESPTEVEQAISRGYEAVIVLTGEDDELIGQKIAGKRVIICPEQSKGVTCTQCRLCSKPRNSIIGFLPHGPSRRKAAASVARSRLP